MTLKNPWLFLAGTVILASILSPLFGHSAAAAGSAPVTVVNTPLPVTGNLGVSGTVTVASLPNVNLAPGSTVRDRDNPALQPYSAFCTGAFTITNISECSFPAVPSGKILVIEEIDVALAVPTGVGFQPLSTLVATQPDLNFFGTNHALTLTYQGTGNGLDRYATHQLTRLYQSSSSNTAGCSTEINGAAPTGSVSCAISGYFVDRP